MRPGKPRPPVRVRGVGVLGPGKPLLSSSSSARASPLVASAVPGGVGGEFIEAHVDSKCNVVFGTGNAADDTVSAMFAERHTRGNEDIFDTTAADPSLQSLLFSRPQHSHTAHTGLNMDTPTAHTGHNVAPIQITTKPTQETSIRSESSQSSGSPATPKICYNQLSKFSKVGRGNFGDVFRVVDRYNPSAVYALKKVTFSKSAEEVKNLKWSRKPKRHLVLSHTAFWSKSLCQVCILMEYMPYGSLKDYVTKSNMTSYDIHIVAISLLDALFHLRRRHIVHRDIKPANILIGYGGAVKLADFGISRMTDMHDNSLAFSLVGSETWMSPERLRGEGYSYPSDVYSVGLVLGYLALGGKHPISSDLEEYRQVSLQSLFMPANMGTAGEVITSAAYDERIDSIVFRATDMAPDDRPTAADCLREYWEDPCFASVLHGGDYGVDVRRVRPLHPDDEAHMASMEEGGEAANHRSGRGADAGVGEAAAAAAAAAPAAETTPAAAAVIRGSRVRSPVSPTAPTEIITITNTTTVTPAGPSGITRKGVVSAAVAAKPPSSPAAASRGVQRGGGAGGATIKAVVSAEAIPLIDASITTAAATAAGDVPAAGQEMDCFAGGGAAAAAAAPDGVGGGWGVAARRPEGGEDEEECCSVGSAEGVVAVEAAEAPSPPLSRVRRVVGLLIAAFVILAAGLAAASTVMGPSEFSGLALPFALLCVACIAFVYNSQAASDPWVQRITHPLRYTRGQPTSPLLPLHASSRSDDSRTPTPPLAMPSK